MESAYPVAQPRRRIGSGSCELSPENIRIKSSEVASASLKPSSRKKFPLCAM
ncbi:MAG: hypothetical protein P8Y51_10640 [Campylobacterales bacterium]